MTLVLLGALILTIGDPVGSEHATAIFRRAAVATSLRLRVVDVPLAVYHILPARLVCQVIGQSTVSIPAAIVAVNARQHICWVAHVEIVNAVVSVGALTGVNDGLGEFFLPGVVPHRLVGNYSTECDSCKDGCLEFHLVNN